MNKKKIILSSLLAGAVVFTGCSSKTDNQETKEVVNINTNDFARVLSTNNEVSFVFKGETVVQDKNTEKQGKLVEMYFDPFCPYCVKAEENLKDVYEEMLTNGKITLKIYPMSFLDPKTKDNYSSRATAYITGAAEYAPEVTFKFMAAIMSSDFHPKIDEATSDEKFKKAFIDAGGNEEQWKKIISAFPILKEKITASTSAYYNNKELHKKSPINKLFAPFIIVDGQDKAQLVGEDWNLFKEDFKLAVNGEEKKEEEKKEEEKKE